MTAEQKIARITEIINRYNINDIPKDEFESMFDKQRLIDLKEEMWELYCFVDDIVDTLNM